MVKAGDLLFLERAPVPIPCCLWSELPWSWASTPAGSYGPRPTDPVPLCLPQTHLLTPDLQLLGHTFTQGVPTWPGCQGLEALQGCGPSALILTLVRSHQLALITSHCSHRLWGTWLQLSLGQEAGGIWSPVTARQRTFSTEAERCIAAGSWDMFIPHLCPEPGTGAQLWSSRNWI